jgi:two-component system, OmpR family, copper resistance phosphate regulon response regulator CusR
LPNGSIEARGWYHCFGWSWAVSRHSSSTHLPYDAGMRLLLVEDDARIARFVAKGLREESYAVDVAATGDDALYQAEINTYDLILLDVMIPGRDGFTVCRELRKAGKRVPILMLTARDAVEDRITGLDHGADDYLTKPFEFRELLARLRALLRRSGELRPPQIVVADLVLDTAAQSVSRAGRDIVLTTKEYALLEYLARNAGRVVGRAEIAEHVWDENFDVFSNLIEVYVNRIRGKIDAGSQKPLLHTRRGAGYLLGSVGETAAKESAEQAAARGTRSKSNPPGRKSHA